VGALTLTTPTLAGVAWTPAAVSASDTINMAAVPGGTTRGCWLVVINGGGSPDLVTVVDSGRTPANSVATNPSNTVTNGTSEAMFIPALAQDPNTNQVTVTHSFTTSVTYVLLPAYAA
jgi:hypothetical protein